VRRWLTRHGWLVAIAGLYLYVFPYFPRLQSANELPRAYLVHAIVEHHTFAIDAEVARWGTTADVSPAGGHSYSNKAPGSSLLVVPVYAVARVFGEPSLATTLWLCRVVSGVVPTLLLLALLSRFLSRYAPEPEVVRFVLVAYALGSMAMVYSILFIAHQLAAVCLAAAWCLAWDFADGRRRMGAIAAAGALAGCAPLIDYQAAFALVPLALGTLWKLRGQRKLVPLAIAAAAALPPIVLLLAYHASCFGSPWRTGYDASTTFAAYHQQGLLGLTHPRWSAFVGSLVSPDNGLLVLSPWLLLAVPGAAVLWSRSDRVTVLVTASIAAIFIAFVSSLTFWRGGWSVGPRYVTEMLPFWLPCIAAACSAWRERPRWAAIAGGLVVIGVAIYALASATYPHWPDDLANPLYEVGVRLVANGICAPNVATALGVPAPVAFAAYAIAVLGLVGWATVRAFGRSVAIVALAIGAAVFATYGAFPRSPNADALYARQVIGVIHR
jgi:hypothetical protein